MHREDGIEKPYRWFRNTQKNKYIQQNIGASNKGVSQITLEHWHLIS